ncbi:MAG TPA: hypothetical protein VJV78_23690 [Polyangiales bacterium]|nr:hypothetical protein [Polyangiales bacterium]
MRPWIQCAGLCLLIAIGPLACGASPASPNGVALSGDEIKGGTKADGGQGQGQDKGKANGKNKPKKPKKAHPDAGVVDGDEDTDEASDRDAATDEADDDTDTDEAADDDTNSDESADDDTDADEGAV